MNGKRLVLAVILGAIAMYLWTSVAHVVTPLGMTGISEMQDEAVVLTAMHSSIGEKPGFYLFPKLGVGPDASREQKNQAMQQYQAKLDQNPSGFVIYHPPGAKAMTAGQLIVEFVKEMAQVFIVVFLIAWSRVSTFGGRVGVAVLVGVASGIGTNVSYWNWFGFPGSYTIAYVSIEVIGFLVAGIVAALAMGKATATRTVAATA